MSPQKDLASGLGSHRYNGCPQSFLVAFCASSRRGTMRPGLAERKVTTQHGKPRGAERIRERCKK
jgi:hypothetical protein